MSRLSLIIQREYLQAVAKKSFIITTLLVPILSIVVCVVVPIMLGSVHSDEQKNIAVIDQSASKQYAPLIKDLDEYHFVDISSQESTEDLHGAASDYYALVLIPSSIDSTLSLSIYSEQSVPSSLGRTVEQSLRPALRQTRIASFGIEHLDEIIAQCDVNLQVQNVKWDQSGEEKLSSSTISEMIGLILALAIYIFVLSYGGMIMGGVVEEKTNRIVEVIISSCKPIELMLGKIIGVALVGFTQFAIWGVMMAIAAPLVAVITGIEMTSTGVVDPSVLAAGADSMTQPMVTAANSGVSELIQMILSVNYSLILTCFLLYFIGGYLLYASLFAAFGSAVDQQQDTAQFMMPIMFFMIFALYAGIFSMENPDGPLAWWCSMIPFTAPITMMVRLPFDVPVWEIILSLGILYLTAFFVLWIASRIYRTGILMYGKKFEWKEILRWIKNS